MRIAFFLLILANLLFFAWAQGHFGAEDAGREPQRLAEQLNPGKMTVTVREERPAPPPPPPPRQACRIIDGVASADAEKLQKALREAGGDLAVSLHPAPEMPAWWVSINSLTNKAVADRKAGELKLLGVTDFHVMQVEGGAFAISLGIFDSEAAAAEFLQGLNRKGVKSARIEPRPKPAATVRIEVRGADEALAARLAPALAGIGGANVADCP